MGVVPDSEENEAACLCGDCPSKGDDGMRFYCVRGRSLGGVTRGFCACSWCPLWSGFGLTERFFCDGGDGGVADTGADDAGADDEAAAVEDSLAGGEEVT